MALTDALILDEIQRVVIESPDFGATWPSGLWTREEVVSYANQRQDRFLKETLCAVSWLPLPIMPGQSQQTLPENWLATRNAFLVDSTEARMEPLAPLTRREADLLLSDWNRTQGTPLGYLQEIWGTRQLTFVPTPATGGVLHLFAAVVGEVLSGLGVALSVPDECAPYVVYGILANMFGKQGRAFDEARRRYCEARYTEGIELTQALLSSVVVS